MDNVKLVEAIKNIMAMEKFSHEKFMLVYNRIREAASERWVLVMTNSEGSETFLRSISGGKGVPPRIGFTLVFDKAIQYDTAEDAEAVRRVYHHRLNKFCAEKIVKVGNEWKLQEVPQ